MNNNELTAELRERIVSLTLCCPKNIDLVDCPFRLLGELCYGTKMDTLRRMDQAALLSLFDYAHTCSCPGDPRYARDNFLMGGSGI